jgi:spoIIIJ-associated protein
MTDEPNKIIKKELSRLLALMTIKADIEVLDKEDTLALKISPKNKDDTKLLVGWHGQTLDALQNLLKGILFKKIKKYHPFVLDVGDYREKREDYLKSIAKKAAEKVKGKGNLIVLDPMSATERRVIHKSLTDFAGIDTESMGEGESRRLVVKLASK